MSERTPVPHQKNPRDALGLRFLTVKRLWRMETHDRVVLPPPARNAEEEGEAAVAVRPPRPRVRWVRRDNTPSLKAWVRSFVGRQHGSSTTPDSPLATAKRWLHNKACNPSKPPLGLGSTRRKKGS